MAWLKKNKSGYKVFKDSDGKTRSVHKRVAEKKIGGSIWGGYEVHHRDGNKSNNRPNNLSVIKRSTHRRIHKK
ncbi:MAG: HNH endonuclease [Candidatus Pacearchaeota archaeon]